MTGRPGGLAAARRARQARALEGRGSPTGCAPTWPLGWSRWRWRPARSWGPVPVEHARIARWVRPALVGEVRFAERTGDGLLRQASWRGLRTDMSPADVPPIGRRASAEMRRSTAHLHTLSDLYDFRHVVLSRAGRD
ncbi:ATP dependent DNA ligase [Nonomuraea sp. NPDC004354]